MPPTGPRTRQQGQPSNAPRPSATSRNEAFESIFGRPAGGHHNPNSHGHAGPSAGPGPAPPPGGSYGYSSSSGYAPSRTNDYLNPAQPSYPPGQIYVPPPPRPAPAPSPAPMPYPQHVYHPPPRGESTLHPQRAVYDRTVDPFARSASLGYANQAGQAPAPFVSLIPRLY